MWRLILNIFLLLPFFCEYLNAQEVKRYIHMSNAELPVILDTLGSKFGVYFSYDADLAAVKNIKSIDTTGTLKELVDILFAGEDISYRYVDKQVVLFKKNDVAIKSEQQPDTLPFKIFQGRVLDISNLSGLPFASVCVSGKSMGTTTNSDGDFIFKVPSKFYNDSLLVIYCGYKTFTKALKDILPSEKMKIMLEINTQFLEPVVITPVDARAIVAKVLKNAGANYPKKAASCTGFFRESTQEDNEYLTICEAVVDIYKGSYQSLFDKDQAKIFKGRKTENDSKTKKIHYKLEGGVMNCLWLDIVKDQTSFLSEDMDLYEYAYAKTVMFDGLELYVISFDQKKDVQLPLFKGFLYIEKKSNALVAAKFGLSPRGIGNAQSILIKKYPKKFKVKPISTSYLVNYRNLNGKWYLDNIRAELKIKAKSEKFLFSSIYSSVSEMSITAIDTLNSRKFKLREIIREDDVMTDCVGIYDVNFWGNYNLIKPEEPIVEAIKRLTIKQDMVHQHKNFWETIF